MPAQVILPGSAAAVTDGEAVGSTVMFLVLLAIVGEAHNAVLVMVTVSTSPFDGVYA